MDDLFYLFGAILALMGVLATLIVKAPQPAAKKVAGLGAAALILPIGYIALSELLAQPKPVGMEWWKANAEEATVLAASMREDVAIYLWLQLEDVEEPRGYVLPWNRDLAEQLQAAQREAEESESQVQMRLPFEDSLDDLEPKFYAMPQPQLPPKELEQPPAHQYDRNAPSDAQPGAGPPSDLGQEASVETGTRILVVDKSLRGERFLIGGQ